MKRADLRALAVLAVSAGGCSCGPGESAPSTVTGTDAGTTSTTTTTGTTTTTTTTTTSTDPCASAAGCPPGPPAGGEPCHESWPGWETWDDFAPSCDLCVPTPEAALPAPIEWEPCDPLANMPVGCRQMKVDWPYYATPFGYGVGGDVASTGQVLLQLMRMSDVASPPWQMMLLAEADGPVRSALLHLSGADDCWLYNHDRAGVRNGSHAFRVQEGSKAEPHREAVVGGAATEARPHAQWLWHESYGHPVTASDAVWATWDSVRIGVARWGEPWQEVFSGVQTGMQQVQPRAWHDFVHWSSSDGFDYIGVMAWTPEREVYPFLMFPGDFTRGVEGFGTDGEHMAWVYEEGGTPGEGTPYPTRSIMVSPFTTDPAALAPVRLRSYPYPWPITVGFTVGCGYAGLQTDGGVAFIVRLSDGWSWTLTLPSPPVAGTWRWGAVYAITCDEVFVRGNLAPKMNVARVRLDALGPGVPPD